MRATGSRAVSIHAATARARQGDNRNRLSPYPTPRQAARRAVRRRPATRPSSARPRSPALVGARLLEPTVRQPHPPLSTDALGPPSVFTPMQVFEAESQMAPVPHCVVSEHATRQRPVEGLHRYGKQSSVELAPIDWLMS